MNKPIHLKALQNKTTCAVLLGICVFSLLFFYTIRYNRSTLMSNEHENLPKVFERFAPLEYCPPTPSNLQGEFDVDFKEEPLDIVDLRLSFALKPGGWFTPEECKPRDRVAIVVPMRGRIHQLPSFLKNIHPMLMRQQIEYAIYVIEQTDDQPFFNRGALFNIGFKESLKMYNWDCFIFHDIDMIPTNDHHLYKCPRSGPMHMGVSLDKFNYKIVYDEIYGGVSGFTTEDYKRINGFSNLFWGWGGEDNDLRNRVLNAQLPILRSPIEVARYKSLPHTFSKINPKWEKQVTDGEKYFNTSGLNSLEYHLKEIKIRSSYVHMIIDHIKEEVGKIANLLLAYHLEDDHFSNWIFVIICKRNKPRESHKSYTIITTFEGLRNENSENNEG